MDGRWWNVDVGRWTVDDGHWSATVSSCGVVFALPERGVDTFHKPRPVTGPVQSLPGELFALPVRDQPSSANILCRSVA